MSHLLGPCIQKGGREREREILQLRSPKDCTADVSRASYNEHLFADLSRSIPWLLSLGIAIVWLMSRRLWGSFLAPQHDSLVIGLGSCLLVIKAPQSVSLQRKQSLSTFIA